MSSSGCSTSENLLQLWNGCNLLPIEGATGLSVNNLVKAHNITSPAHVWVSVFKSGGDGGTSATSGGLGKAGGKGGLQIGKKEIIEPGRCLLLVEYRDASRVVVGGVAPNKNSSAANPRAGMKAVRVYYERQAILDALESMQSSKADQNLEFMAKDVDLVRFELFVQLAPGSRKVTARSLVAIVDPLVVPGGQALTRAMFDKAPPAVRSGTPVPKGAAARSLGGGGSIVSDADAFNDLVSIGGGVKKAGGSGGLTLGTLPGGGGGSGGLLGTSGLKRGRDGAPVASLSASQGAAGAGGGSPTLDDLLQLHSGDGGGGSHDGDGDRYGGGGSIESLFTDDPGASSTVPPSGATLRARHLLEQTAVSLRKQSSQGPGPAGRSYNPPLHAALPSQTKKTSAHHVSQGLPLGDLTWYRYHPHVLSCVIPPATGGTGGLGLGSSSTNTASSKVAAFAIDGTLFTTSMDAQSRGSDAFQLVHPNLPENLKALVEHGYRIIFFASYPSLHHSALYALQEKTERIVKFVRRYCPSFAVTVVLSTVSSFQADSPMHMPQVGLFEYFVANHNRGLKPSPTFSFYCGNLYDPEILAVQSGKRKQRPDESSNTLERNSTEVKKEGGDDEGGRWTYQSAEGGRMSTASAQKEKENAALDQQQPVAEWDVDHSFAQACGLKFVTNGDFYSKVGLPNVF